MARLLLLAAAALALSGCVVPGSSPYVQGRRDVLQQRFAGTPVAVIHRGEVTILRMPADVTFEVDRVEIAPAFRPVLDLMADTILEYPDGEVQVVGHADAAGADAYNEALSARRAAAVGDYLASQGVERSRLAPEGRGEREPVATNDTAEGRALNRRVEVVLQPVKRPPVASAAPP